MAVKVIGKSQSVVRNTVCRNCSSILEYTQADTFTEKVSDYTGDSEIVRFLKCPVCGENLRVKP